MNLRESVGYESETGSFVYEFERESVGYDSERRTVGYNLDCGSVGYGSERKHVALGQHDVGLKLGLWFCQRVCKSKINFVDLEKTLRGLGEGGC